MAGAPPSGNQGENSSGMLWSIAALFAALGTIWYVFSEHIITGYLFLKLYEVNFLNYLAGVFADRPNYFDTLKSALLYAHANPKAISFNTLIVLGNSVGTWLRVPFIILLIILGIVVYTGSVTRMYRRTYTMKDLAKFESTNWPQIIPVLNMDLLKTDIDSGPWAMAMTPLQFCKKNNLLEEVRPQKKEGVSRKEWDKIQVVLKRGQANKIFALQLGPLWKGTKFLPPYAKALFAAFAARINSDTKAAEKLFAQLSESSTSKNLNYEGVIELLNKHEKTKPVQTIVQSHAYVTTVMASMLAGARDDGVQASADFLWLKPRDRRLWYTLNTVGRQTPFIEIAGIFAHWIAEKEAGRKLIVPMVEEATHATELALKEVIYRPDEVA